MKTPEKHIKRNANNLPEPNIYRGTGVVASGNTLLYQAKTHKLFDLWFPARWYKKQRKLAENIGARHVMTYTSSYHSTLLVEAWEFAPTVASPMTKQDDDDYFI